MIYIHTIRRARGPGQGGKEGVVKKRPPFFFLIFLSICFCARHLICSELSLSLPPANFFRGGGGGGTGAVFCMNEQPFVCSLFFLSHSMGASV